MFSKTFNKIYINTVLRLLIHVHYNLLFFLGDYYRRIKKGNIGCYKDKRRKRLTDNYRNLFPINLLLF
jgi:hypothetical protein